MSNETIGFLAFCGVAIIGGACFAIASRIFIRTVQWAVAEIRGIPNEN